MSKYTFVRSQAWRSETGEKLPFDKLKLATSDTDYDGLMDLVVFRDRGEAGTEILTFRTLGTSAYGVLSPGLSVHDGTVDGSTVRPY